MTDRGHGRALARGRLIDSAGGVTVLLMEATTQWAHPEPGRRQTWGWILGERVPGPSRLCWCRETI